MQEAPYKILVPSLLGTVLFEAARPCSLGEAVLVVGHDGGGDSWEHWPTSQAAGAMCPLQLGGGTLKPEHDLAQKSSCFLPTLFVAVRKSARSLSGLHRRWWPLRRCYSTFTGGGQQCVRAVAWLCTVREVPKERCVKFTPGLHRPWLQ